MSSNLAVILSESARSAPDHPVAMFDGGQLTYRQLDRASDRVAANLAEAGIGAGDAVALQLPNIPQFLISYFGILKAGAVVVPLNVLLRAPSPTVSSAAWPSSAGRAPRKTPPDAGCRGRSAAGTMRA